MANHFSVVVFPQNTGGVSISLPVNTDRLIHWHLQNDTAAPPSFHCLLFMVVRRAKEHLSKYKTNELRNLTTRTGNIYSLLSQPTDNQIWYVLMLSVSHIYLKSNQQTKFTWTFHSAMHLCQYGHAQRSETDAGSLEPRRQFVKCLDYSRTR